MAQYFALISGRAANFFWDFPSPRHQSITNAASELHGRKEMNACSPRIIFGSSQIRQGLGGLAVTSFAWHKHTREEEKRRRSHEHESKRKTCPFEPAEPRLQRSSVPFLVSDNRRDVGCQMVIQPSAVFRKVAGKSPRDFLLLWYWVVASQYQ